MVLMTSTSKRLVHYRGHNIRQVPAPRSLQSNIHQRELTEGGKGWGGKEKWGEEYASDLFGATIKSIQECQRHFRKGVFAYRKKKNSRYCISLIMTYTMHCGVRTCCNSLEKAFCGLHSNHRIWLLVLLSFTI